MADILASEANDVTLVDIDAGHLRTLQDRLDIRTVTGNASFPTVLSQAGADDADLLLAVTNSDEINMMACQVAHSLFNTPTKISRVRSPNYLTHQELFRPRAIPVDVLISPEQVITEHITRLIEYPSALQVLGFAGGRIQLVSVRAYQGGSLVGHPLRELREHMPTIDTRVAAIYRGEEVVIPKADTVIQPDDEVFFVAARRHIATVMSEMRHLEKPVKRVMLAGGGNIGFRLARELENKRYNIKLVERDRLRAETIADGLDETVVLHGDAADEDMLVQENIRSMDVFCAVTNNDEANILSAMLAKRLGARRVMALINRSVYVGLFERSDIITLHCPMSEDNYHLLDEAAFEQMKDGVMIVNTSRGGLLDSAAAVEALKRGRIGALGLDVYEHEKELFFQDKSNDVIVDDVFRRLSACHNVLFTGHQAFLTHEALGNIADTTLANIATFAKGATSGNEVIDL